MALFSIPAYPGATSYSIQRSDPAGGDPYAPNPFGTWTTVGTYTDPTNIIDGSGDQNLALYRAAPTISVNSQSVVLPYYDAFSVGMSEPGVYQAKLYDPRITTMLPAFRDFIADTGEQYEASTNVDLDDGAGTALLEPDGARTSFSLAATPDAKAPVVLEASVVVVKNGATLQRNVDYVVRYEDGVVVFATAPAVNDVLSISYRSVRYTNRSLNAALANALERLMSLGISGYGVTYDNNVTVAVAPVGDDGLRTLVFMAAQKILNAAMTWYKAVSARSYKTDGFSIDTTPARLLDGMSNQSKIDLSEIRDMANRYIRSATMPLVYGDYDSYLNPAGSVPGFIYLPIFGFPYWI